MTELDAESIAAGAVQEGGQKNDMPVQKAGLTGNGALGGVLVF